MAKLRSVLIMTGGTGGHVFPGLAVAKQLQQAGIEVNWLGTQKGLEAKLVPQSNIPIHFIEISGVRGKSWKDLILAPWRLTLAVIQAAQIIRRLKPDVVLGMGGFVSGPGGIASWLLRQPLVIHEQNAIPGTTNKWLSCLAKKVLEGFPNTFPKRSHPLTVGNPVRPEIINLPNPEVRFREHKGPLRLLVIGGSLGAAAINQLVPKAIAQLAENERPNVFHQTGEKHFEETLKIYSEHAVTAEIHPFIVEMDKAYAWADIVLCRAGALTVTELCAAGLGAIFVPFPFAIDDHQTANANFMVKQGAGKLIHQKDLTVECLIDLIRQLQKEQKKCLDMAQSAYKLRRIDSAETVLRICQEVSA